jgi:hypothetical protein
MRTRPQPGTRVHCGDRAGTVVAPDDPRSTAYRKQRQLQAWPDIKAAESYSSYVQWDDGPNGNGGGGLCLVAYPVLQPL